MGFLRKAFRKVGIFFNLSILCLLICGCLSCQPEQNKVKTITENSVKQGNGLVEDNPRLAVLKKARAKQQEEVSRLEQKFEEYKQKAQPIKTSQQYVKQARDEFREYFIAENGAPENWTEQQQKEYAEVMNKADWEGNLRWQLAQDEYFEDSRMLGIIWTELAEAKTELEKIDREIENISTNKD